MGKCNFYELLEVKEKKEIRTADREIIVIDLKLNKNIMINSAESEISLRLRHHYHIVAYLATSSLES
jgi:hypothetical protein